MLLFLDAAGDQQDGRINQSGGMVVREGWACPEPESYWMMKLVPSFLLSGVATLPAESGETGSFPGYRDLLDGEGTIRYAVLFCARAFALPYPWVRPWFPRRKDALRDFRRE